MMKAKSNLVAALALSALFAGFLVPASADTVDSNVLDAKTLNTYSEIKVNPAVGSKLTSMVKRGERLDSEDPNATPVSTDSWTTGNMRYTKDTFKDGSFEAVGLETPQSPSDTDRDGKPGAVKAHGSTSMKGCTSTSGSGYVSRKNCKIRALGATYDASFLADFTHTNSKIGTIGKVRSPRISVIGGTHSKTKLKINRKKSTSRLPAEASLSWHFNGKGGVASGDVYLYLQVKAKSTKIIVD